MLVSTYTMVYDCAQQRGKARSGEDCLSNGGPLFANVPQYVAELTFTAWDVEAFARGYGYPGPPFRRI